MAGLKPPTIPDEPVDVLDDAALKRLMGADERPGL